MDGQDLAARRAPGPRRAALGVLLAMLAVSRGAETGHVMALGQYKYGPDQLRPQLRISQRVDDRQFEVSGYPGNPAPGEVVDFRVTVDDGGGPRAGQVECTVHRVGLLGARRRVVEWRSGDSGDDRFRISLPDDAEYDVTFAIADGTTHSSALSFPLVVGKPGSPWTILGGFGGGLALFIAAVVIVGRVRDRRTPSEETA